MANKKTQIVITAGIAKTPLKQIKTSMLNDEAISLKHLSRCLMEIAESEEISNQKKRRELLAMIGSAENLEFEACKLKFNNT